MPDVEPDEAGDEYEGDIAADDPITETEGCVTDEPDNPDNWEEYDEGEGGSYGDDEGEDD